MTSRFNELRFCDEHGNPIEHEDSNGVYRSHSPIPIPHPGDTIVANTGMWRVEKRELVYLAQDDNTTVVHATVTCSHLE